VVCSGDMYEEGARRRVVQWCDRAGWRRIDDRRGPVRHAEVEHFHQPRPVFPPVELAAASLTALGRDPADYGRLTQCPTMNMREQDGTRRHSAGVDIMRARRPALTGFAQVCTFSPAWRECA
jgi:hypothetical protein